MSKPKLGVVLFQLGGPDSPEAVEPFLYNLFCDPDIINFPLAWLARRPLARYISQPPRAGRPRTLRRHRRPLTDSPADRAAGAQLEAALAPDFDVRCWVAMRYWHPLTAEAVAAVRAEPLDALVLLPLYPHYSFATTLSSLKEWKRLYRPARGRAASETVVEEFHTHPLYIEALAERIATSLTHFDDPAACIWFSARMACR